MRKTRALLFMRTFLSLSSAIAAGACRSDEHPTGVGIRADGFFASTGTGPNGTWHYVKPGGISSGTGADSLNGAWGLQHALNGAPDPALGGNQLQPGDTVWLLSGTYNGTFTETVVGQPGLPIV